MNEKMDFTYKKTIEKLNKEIQKKNEIIKYVSEFESLELSDKIEVLKECDLRYDREEMPKVLQKCFKSKTLKNGKASLGINHFYIECNNYTFSIALYSTKLIEIENKEKTCNMSLREESKINEDNLEQIKIIDKFLENPTYFNYKNLIDNLNIKKKLVYKVNYFFNKDNIINRERKRLCALNSFINYQKKSNEEYRKDIENNKILEAKNDEFLELIKEDLEYFKENGYKVRLKFKSGYFN